jgi:FAD:protein FMN transferase
MGCRLLAGCVAIGTGQAAEPLTLTGRAMGTTWSVKLVPPEESLEPAALTREIADRIEQLEQQFSTYRADSEISRFNAAASGEWIPVFGGLADVVAESAQISALTDGAFDVTVGPLLDAWGVGPRGRRAAAPSAGEIAAARRHVGWGLLETRLDPAALRKRDPGVRLELSSIAKGYAVDQLSGWLEARGATRHAVQIGGDIRARGDGPGGGRGWRFAVEAPREESAAIAAVVELDGGALSTSGNYRNYVVIGGRPYGHIIDPRTGHPAASRLAAVSVVHASAAWSSSLATGLFVFGPEEAWRLAVRERIACLLQVREGAGEAVTLRATAEFERLRR